MRYRIAHLEIDTETRELSASGIAKRVEPQVFDLLLFLLENRHRVVGKDELVETIWEGRAISDATLSCCVKSARRALGDDGQRQRMIRTVHRRGFRFVEPVEVPDVVRVLPAMEAAPSRNESRNDPRETCPGCPSCAGAQARSARAIAPSGEPSLAVLPFQVRGDDDAQLLAEALQRDVTAQFARVRWLFVSARASVMVLADRGHDPEEISDRLGVRYLLDGALVVADNRLRLTLTLTDAQRCREVWAERFERRLDDVFAIQDEIVDLIAFAVEAEIEREERRHGVLHMPTSLEGRPRSYALPGARVTLRKASHGRAA